MTSDEFFDFKTGFISSGFMLVFLKKETNVWKGTQFLHGGDVDEQRHFLEGKLVAHGQILFLTLLRIFNERKSFHK